MLATIGYISNATEHLKKGDIENIVKDAILYNKKHGITGILYFANGKFLQFIEGDRAEIEALYQKLSKDSRHNDFVKFHDADISERAFGEWDMAIRKSEDYKASELELFNDIFNIYKLKVYKTAEKNRVKIKTLIDIFRKPAVNL